MGGEAGASLEIIMITRKTMPAVGVLALLAASPFASAQTINVAGPFDFVDTLVGPEAGSNSVATGRLRRPSPRRSDDHGRWSV